MDENQTNTPAPRDRGQTILILFVMLAIICSVVMLLTNSETYLKISVVVSLWSALLGLFISVQMRRDRDVARSISAAQAVELDLAYSKQEVEEFQLRALEELKEQVNALQNQLEQLAGQPFYEQPPALRAEARRVQELTPESSSRTAETNVETTADKVVDPVSSEGPASLDDAVAANRTAESNTKPSQGDAELEARRRAADARREEARKRAQKAEAERQARKKAEQEAATAKAEEETKARRQAEAEALARKQMQEQEERQRALRAQREAAQKQNLKQTQKQIPSVDPAAGTEAAARAQAARTQAQAKPVRGTGFDTTSFRRVNWMTGEHTDMTTAFQDAPEPSGRRAAHSAPGGNAAAANTTAGGAHEAPEAAGGGRRRRENKEGALGLEELLKNLKKD
ncbi:MAG: hypothetical protein Q3972_08495 [Corynebacterium sp.]|nr:hypothetical protein [Corynebacterium sp.]